MCFSKLIAHIFSFFKGNEKLSLNYIMSHITFAYK